MICAEIRVVSTVATSSISHEQERRELSISGHSQASRLKDNCASRIASPAVTWWHWHLQGQQQKHLGQMMNKRKLPAVFSWFKFSFHHLHTQLHLVRHQLRSKPLFWKEIYFIFVFVRKLTATAATDPWPSIIVATSLIPGCPAWRYVQKPSPLDAAAHSFM